MERREFRRAYETFVVRGLVLGVVPLARLIYLYALPRPRMSPNPRGSGRLVVNTVFRHLLSAWVETLLRLIGSV